MRGSFCHYIKHLGEERVYFTLKCTGHTVFLTQVRPATKDRDTDTRANAETVGECCVLTCTP